MFIANKRQQLVSGTTEKSLWTSSRHGRTLPSSRKRLVSAPGFMGIRPHRKTGKRASSLSLAIQSRKAAFLRVTDLWQLLEQGPVNTADHCEVRAARLDNTWRCAYEVCTSVIAESLRMVGLSGRRTSEST